MKRKETQTHTEFGAEVGGMNAAKIYEIPEMNKGKKRKQETNKKK